MSAAAFFARRLTLQEEVMENALPASKSVKGGSDPGIGPVILLAWYCG